MLTNILTQKLLTSPNLIENIGNILPFQHPSALSFSIRPNLELSQLELSSFGLLNHDQNPFDKLHSISLLNQSSLVRAIDLLGIPSLREPEQSKTSILNSIRDAFSELRDTVTRPFPTAIQQPNISPQAYANGIEPAASYSRNVTPVRTRPIPYSRKGQERQLTQKPLFKELIAKLGATLERVAMKVLNYLRAVGTTKLISSP